MTCYIDGRWHGVVDQIAVLSAQRMTRGDLWIDWIEIGKGPAEPHRSRPDLASRLVVPEIEVPGIAQTGFSKAFSVLDECLIVDVPIYGFNYPVMSPGGYYSNGGWWQIDSNLNVVGAKWTNPRFAENVMRGFIELQQQNPDGRIDLMGQHGIRGQVGDLSSLPVYFEVAYDIARRTEDDLLRHQIYDSMRKYLDWWLSPVKRDSRTGLISGDFEETFGDVAQAPHLEKASSSGLSTVVAPVDLNVEVAVGAYRTAALADALGNGAEATHYHQIFEDLSRAINRYLWNDEAGAYYNYDLREQKLRVGLNVTTFDPLRLAIAPVRRRDRLLTRLRDPAQFNWGRHPLASWAMTEPGYVEAKGDYDGRAWFGDIWTLRNMAVVAGLEDSGRADLAAELNWATIKEFHENYREFLVPSSGEGQGAVDYGWTASQYIGAIIDHLFGIVFDGINKRITITPHVPRDLYGKSIALRNIVLPHGESRLSVVINELSSTSGTVAVHLSRSLPDFQITVELPDNSTPVTRTSKGGVKDFVARFR